MKKRILCFIVSWILCMMFFTGCVSREDGSFSSEGEWNETPQSPLADAEGWTEEEGVLQETSEENGSEILLDSEDSEADVHLPSVLGRGELEDYSDLSFDEFLDALFQEAANADTLTLHFFLTDPEKAGIEPGPVTLGRVEGAKEEELESIALLGEILESYPREELSREQRITADILTEYLDCLEKDFEMQYYFEIFNQGMGLHVSLPYALAEYVFYDEQDVEDYLTLLQDLDAYYRSALDWERQKAEEGLFISDESLDAVLEECRVYLWDGEEDFFLRESFRERLEELEGLTEAEIRSYMERHDKILKEDFTAAYRNLIDGLEELRGSGTNDKGLYYYPRGKEYYEYLIECNIGMTYESVEELFEVIHQDVLDILEEVRDILYGEGKEGVLEEVTRKREVTETPEEMLEDLRRRILEDFPNAEGSDYRIKKVTPSMEDVTSPAFYMIPPLDRYDRNVIYLNDKTLKEQSYNVYSVLAHEGFPGHLYQNLLYHGNPHSRLRAVMQYTGYSEGWGTYAELYSYRWMEEQSEDAREANYLMARLNLAYAAYLDIAIHYYGWDETEVQKFCQEWMGIDSKEAVDSLYDYIIGNPAGYLDYYVGYLEILKLRDRAQEALGDRYQTKAFHQFVMEFGPAPFTVIRPYLEEWIEGQR